MSPTTLSKKLASLYRGVVLSATAWSLLLGLSLYWNISENASRAIELAGIEAKTHLQRDLAFRRWATSHGGLYILTTEETRPNPYLAGVPERDVVTPSGRLLTLYNPATLLRLIMETQAKLYGVRARITAERYLNPINAPDAWESKALAIVAGTLDDYVEVTTIDGQPMLRRMQPMIMDEGCLKCHAWTGIKVGELRGATDVAVPIAPYLALQQDANRKLVFTHSGLWLAGLGFLGAMTVRRRKAAQQAHADGEALRKLSLAVEQSASGIVITDRRGIIEYANQSMTEISGYSVTELVGNNPRLLKSGETGEDVYREMWRTLLAGHAWHGEFHNRHKSGALYWCLENIAPVKDELGHVTHFVAVVKDDTERRRAEAQLQKWNEELEERVRIRTADLEAANKDLEAFSYSVSHDLRTPLRAINGFSRIVLEEEGDRLTADGQEMLVRIERAATRLGELIDDVLEYSRAGRLALERQHIDLGMLARSVADELRSAYPAADIRIGELPAVTGDPKMIRQVFENLIGNACKYSARRSDPVVEIGGRKENGEVTVWVRDNGVGFDMRYADKLFGMFQRLHADRDFEGSGVGLAIVKRLVERHGGRIWAEAVVERGASFYFTLGDA